MKSLRKMATPGRIASIVFTGLLLTTLTVCHRWHHATPEKKAEWIVDKLSNYLDLTDVQLKRLNEIKAAVLEKRKELKITRGRISTEIINEIKKNKIDQEKIKNLLDEKSKRFRKLRNFYIKQMTEFHKILTPEQRNILAEKLTKWHKRFKHHW